MYILCKSGAWPHVPVTAAIQEVASEIGEFWEPWQVNVARLQGLRGILRD